MYKRDMTEEITITLTRQECWDITGMLARDVFEGKFNDLYDKIWNAAFPEDDDV